jgi:hypothetical protein
MIGLAGFIDEHREAVERDLFVQTGHELADVGSTLSWGALKSFLSHVQLGSALGGELNPDMTEWSTRAKTNAILADIYDQLSIVNANLRVLITHKPGRKPEPYKRPGMDTEKQRIGKKPLPISKMREWIESKRRKEVVSRGEQ